MPLYCPVRIVYKTFFSNNLVKTHIGSNHELVSCKKCDEINDRNDLVKTHI